MTRDYAKPSRRPPRARNTRYQPSRKTAPGWVWGLAGIIIGAAGVKVYDYQANPQLSQGQAEATTPTQDDKPLPKFDFYTLLTANEEVVPEEPEVIEAAPAEPVNAPAKETIPDTPKSDAPAVATQQDTQREVYVLQAGSFRNAGDADALRARLILLNMQASVEKVNPRPGETWHRVLVGPFSDTQRLGNARRELRQNGIDSIQVKRRL